MVTMSGKISVLHANVWILPLLLAKMKMKPFVARSHLKILSTIARIHILHH